MFSVNGHSGELDGIKSIPDGVKSFFDPLKKGPKYIDESLSTIPSLNGESRVFAEKQVANSTPEDLNGKLRKIMISEQQGKVIAYKEIDSQVKLNGSFVIKTYEVKFFGGKSKTLEFKFLKPTINGNYHFVDAHMLD